MRIRLCAVGTRVPNWVSAGVEEYARRLPRENRLDLVEVAAADRRGAGGEERWRAEEAERLRQAAAGARMIALEVRGRMLSTEQLSARMEDWRMEGRDVALLVGGADGIAPALLDDVESLWSLSPLTLPHALVRVVVAEQIYRAWTMLSGHPYHR
ncbi:MAG: 23S rRNA (pseudouridine(1915)-N(3))-methyltransferase RlmH [Pseudomonadales bacterium]|nr:23S rRNA (pseudouridine(1915)-N(3))-methyltransferase RlmH [Pseudomonadales bacterium]